MRFKKALFFVFIAFNFILTSCDDPELNALMDDYCSCISESRTDSDKLIDCLEKMDSIQERYKNKPGKLSAIISKTDECY
ncbi:MAG TPA: hypothetical protein VKX31_07685 [Brumimicrobium sp.]|nr:hypothetical protein [Brumimicrobium sp.]